MKASTSAPWWCFSDGEETERALVRAALPDLRVFTVGVGDTIAPEDVRIDDAEYSPVVRVPSRAMIRAGIAASGPAAKRVHVRLAEGQPDHLRSRHIVRGRERERTMNHSGALRKTGRREMVLSVSTSGKDVSPDNNRRDICDRGARRRAHASW
jgi:hypothetical protein